MDQSVYRPQTQSVDLLEPETGERPSLGPGGGPSLLPLHMMRRSSVRPGPVVPKVRLCKAPSPSYLPEVTRRHRDDTAHLQIPKWKYKKKAEECKEEEAARQQLFQLLKRK